MGKKGAACAASAAGTSAAEGAAVPLQELWGTKAMPASNGCVSNYLPLSIHLQLQDSSIQLQALVSDIEDRLRVGLRVCAGLALPGYIIFWAELELMGFRSSGV